MGYNFSFLPANAIGILSTDNEDPLQHRYNHQQHHEFTLDVVDDTHLTAHFRSDGTSSNPKYLGAFISPDGSAVYWVNESKPLP